MTPTDVRRKRNHLESQHQRSYVEWARHHPVARKVYAIPNGGKRGRIEAAIMKAEGVRAGMPDTALPVARGSCIGLFVEFKAGDGALSANQRDVIDELVADGHAVVVAWSWVRAKELTEAYLRGELSPGLMMAR